MSRSTELAKNTAILTIGKMCTQFISFLLLPLYTAILTPDEYGIVDLFATYVSLILPLVCWQLDQGIFRFILDIRNEKEKIQELFSSVFFLNLLQCVLFSGAFMLISPLIKSEFKYYLLFSVIFNVYSGLFMQFARGLGKMVNYSISSFLTAVSTVLLNVVFIAVLKLGAHGMLLATLLGIVINCLYLFSSLKVWEYIRIKKIHIDLIEDVCKYSVPMVPNQISGWVLNASDRTIIAKVLDVGANGVYSIANKFSNLMGTFYGFVNTAWIENVSLHYNDDDRDVYISDMMATILNIFIALCVGIIAVMPFVFDVMIDGKYAAAFYQIPILMVAVIFQILVGLYSAIYIALKKSVTIARTTFFGAIVNIIVDVSLIKFIGLYAASISTLVSFVTVALYRRYDIRKYVSVKINCADVWINTAMIAVVSATYYMRNNWISVVVLFLVVFYAFFINRKIVVLFLDEFKKFRRNGRR